MSDSEINLILDTDIGPDCDDAGALTAAWYAVMGADPFYGSGDYSSSDRSNMVKWYKRIKHHERRNDRK